MKSLIDHQVKILIVIMLLILSVAMLILASQWSGLTLPTQVSTQPQTARMIYYLPITNLSFTIEQSNLKIKYQNKELSIKINDGMIEELRTWNGYQQTQSDTYVIQPVATCKYLQLKLDNKPGNLNDRIVELHCSTEINNVAKLTL